MNKKMIISGIAIATLVLFSIIWFGLYNVAANDKHYALTLSLLEMVRDRSIKVRAEDIEIPELDDPQQIKAGAVNYAQMCSGCHLAPGMSPTELHQGLYPQPPNFSQPRHSHHTSADLFWVIKNGIKMTGMPAWSPAHTDQQIWQMVAFIEQLDDISVEQYRQLTTPTDESGTTKHDSEHGVHSH